MAVVLEQAIYTDVNHVPFYETHKDLQINEDSVIFSLHNLLTTEVGQRLNNIEYGVNLPDYLFEQIDDNTTFQLYHGITSAIARWEPRVKLNRARSKVTPYPDENAYYIDLHFDITGLSDGDFTITGLYKKQQ